MPSVEDLRRCFGRTVFAAEEEDARARGDGARRQQRHEVGAGDAVGNPLSREPSEPQHRLAVRDVQVAPREHGTDRVVAACVHDEVQVDGADLHELAVVHRGQGAVDRSVEIHRVDRNPTDDRAVGVGSAVGDFAISRTLGSVPLVGLGAAQEPEAVAGVAQHKRRRGEQCAVRRRRCSSCPQAAEHEEHETGGGRQPRNQRPTRDGTDPVQHGCSSRSPDRGDGEDPERGNEEFHDRIHERPAAVRDGPQQSRHGVRITWTRPPSHRIRCVRAAAPPFAMGARRQASPANWGRMPARRRSADHSRSSALVQRVPRMFLEQAATEAHPVPDEMTRQSERGPTAETDAVEQQHRGRPKFRSSPAAVREGEISLAPLRRSCPAFRRDR